MADMVETMAYDHEVPWHGSGHNVRSDDRKRKLTVQEMIKLAKVDWLVDLEPIYWGDKMVPTKVGQALVRRPDKKVLDIVGPNYVPTQNKEAFDFFNEFVDRGGASMETMGSLAGGTYVWGLADLKAEFNVVKGDKVKGYLLVVCPHRQGKALLIKTTAIRVVCMNTLRLAMSEAGDFFRMIHRQKFDERMQQKARETIGLAREQVDEFKATASKLRKMRIDDEDAIKIFAKVFRKDADSTVIEKVVDCYNNAPGADAGNGWGVLNGVTYYVDHIASRTVDKRLTNAWMGKGERIKRRALDELVLIAR